MLAQKSRVLRRLVPGAAALGLLAVPMVATPASAGQGDLIVTNGGSYRSLYICRDWVDPNASSSLTCPSVRGVLFPGQNSQSEYGWPDTDAVGVSVGYRMTKFVSAPSPGYWMEIVPCNTTNKFRYYKVSGGVFVTAKEKFREVSC